MELIPQKAKPVGKGHDSLPNLDNSVSPFVMVASPRLVEIGSRLGDKICLHLMTRLRSLLRIPPQAVSRILEPRDWRVLRMLGNAGIGYVLGKIGPAETFGRGVCDMQAASAPSTFPSRRSSRVSEKAGHLHEQYSNSTRNQNLWVLIDTAICWQSQHWHLPVETSGRDG